MYVWSKFLSNLHKKCLQYLNRIQRKDAERPDDVGEYDENWKVKNDDTREENFSKRV